MKLINYRIPILIMMLFAGYASIAQTTASNHSATTKTNSMKTYLIERDIPGAGKLTPEQLKAISQKSCAVLKEMGPKIEWIQSYVTGDKIFCVYKAQNEELIREHAKKGGFPANKIMEIHTGISPATALAK
ncbi:MAG TPA: DUF4242 domain-containing protein [Hanamia sp.]